MAKTSLHVVLDPDGGWSVVKGGSTHATRRFDTKKEAVSYGRKVSKAEGSEFYVHDSDGMIRSKVSYRSAPLHQKDER
jgi:hypothetical protein